MRKEQAKLRGISQDSGRKVVWWAGLVGGQDRGFAIRTPASCKLAQAGIGKNPPLTPVCRKGESEGRVEKPGERAELKNGEE